ncbi:trichohyalin-like [Corticium candelabrum]|uniref:trichohyalin-like n=1 Tax=Corticium candelabrum TaxID=121492 RepID=UPI002E2770D7|nr:trichohyalin-like [Corticium candelabrum]
MDEDLLHARAGETPLYSVDMYTSAVPSTTQTMSPRGVENPPLAQARQPPRPRPIPRARNRQTAAGHETYRPRATKSSEIQSTNFPVLADIPSSAPPTTTHRHDNPWLNEHNYHHDDADLYTSFQPTTNQPTHHTTIQAQANPTSSVDSNASDDLYGGPYSINYQSMGQRVAEYEQQLRRKDETIGLLQMELERCRRRLMSQDELERKEGLVESRRVVVQQQEERQRRLESQLRLDREALARQREEVERDRAAVGENQFVFFNKDRQLKQSYEDIQTQKQELEMREAKLTNWERRLGETEQEMKSRERKVELDARDVAKRSQDVEKRERDIERHEYELVRQQMHTQPPVLGDFERDRRSDGTLLRTVVSDDPLRRRQQLSDDEELARRLQEEEQRTGLVTSPSQPRHQPSLADDAAIARQLQQQLELEAIEEQHQRLRREQERGEREAEEKRKRREETERRDRELAEEMQRQLNAAPREENDALLARQLAEQDEDDILTQNQPGGYITEVGQTDDSPRARQPSGHFTIEQIERNLNSTN